MYDCVWANYEPTLPVFSMSLTDDYDETRDYRPWKCNGEDEMMYEDGFDTSGDVIIEGEGIIDDDYTDSF